MDLIVTAAICAALTSIQVVVVVVIIKTFALINKIKLIEKQNLESEIVQLQNTRIHISL